MFLSSGGAFHGDTMTLPADADTPPAPVSPYGRHKLAAEELVRTSDLPFGITDLLAALERRLGRAVEVRHEPARPGDVRSSTLSPARIARDLGWRAAFRWPPGWTCWSPDPGTADRAATQ